MIKLSFAIGLVVSGTAWDGFVRLEDAPIVLQPKQALRSLSFEANVDGSRYVGGAVFSDSFASTGLVPGTGFVVSDKRSGRLSSELRSQRNTLLRCQLEYFDFTDISLAGHGLCQAENGQVIEVIWPGSNF